MKLAIAIGACTGFQYAMESQARRVQAAAARAEPGHILLAMDEGEKAATIHGMYESLMGPMGWSVEWLRIAPPPVSQGQPRNSAFMLVGQMRALLTARARALKADRLWFLDSDVLPPANALECSLWALEFDRGWYSVAFCPYPSQGIGPFLSGFGSPMRHIEEDFLPRERRLPADLAARIKEHEQVPMEQRDGEFFAKGRALMEEARKHPPDGNVWEVNGKYGWRRRGWFDCCYPGIGQGAMVPVDWCGFGCTLLNEQAIRYADWESFDGGGTEDLWCIWRHWHQRGLRICALPHCACDHVVRDREKGGPMVHQMPQFATDPEHRGHLRSEPRPYYPASIGTVWRGEPNRAEAATPAKGPSPAPRKRG